ncbi:MAG: ABC transporter ATP-binding protein [Lachnospiraceae bacterium]|nr:ABC transporter ATP-binding protein [Lachnospiraceae bacterium]
MTDNNIVSIRGLKVGLASTSGYVYAVRNINLDIKKGEILGLVGESGCGKSMTAKSILRLHDEQKTEYHGEIIYEDGKDILKMSEEELSKLRGGEISMIFQDPITTLNPLVQIGKQMMEMFKLHSNISKDEAKEKCLHLLEAVGITPAEERFHSYPFQMSGGQLQRVSIAMSLACDPKLLIADEPTTALDVTMQAQILELLKKLRDEFGTSILVITHNFGVVAEICSRVAVMYAGQIVESGDVKDIFYNPKHPYTRDLIGSIPKTGCAGEKLVTIPGAPPQLNRSIEGCPYEPRCKYADESCHSWTPELVNETGEHLYLCRKDIKSPADGGLK